MTLIELKKHLHEKLEIVNDEHLLRQVDALLDSDRKVFIIPEHMKEGIRKGKEDLKNGNFITLEDLERKYEKWLKE